MRNTQSGQLRHFVEFILQRNILSLAVLRRVAEFHQALDVRLGQLAAIKGYLNPVDIVQVLVAQADSDAAFGELCVRHRLMSAEQRDDLLALQKNNFRLFCECLEWSGALAPDELVHLKREFLATSTRVEPTPEVECRPRSAAEVRDVLRRVREVAALPDVVQRVLGVLNTPDAGLREASRIIESDPVLSAQLLRVSNSALFTARGKITSVNRAVIMLGARGTRQVVLSTAVASMFEGLPEEEARSLWSHSLLSGRWGTALARAQMLPEPEDAGVAGVVHEFGTVILAQYFPKETAAVRAACAKGMSEREAELETFGLTHAEVGAYVAQQWTFPSRIVESILYHHTPVEKLPTGCAIQPLTRIVNAACRLADVDLDGYPEEWIASLGEEFCRYHDLTPERLSRLAPDVRREAEERARKVC